MVLYKVLEIYHFLDFKIIEKLFLIIDGTLLEKYNDTRLTSLIKMNIKQNKFVEKMLNKLQLIKKIDFLN
jgi:hypothetical protein